MSELAVLSQDITKVDSDRSLYQSEFSTLGTYINNLATKDFNGVSLFDGVARNVNTHDQIGVLTDNLSSANSRIKDVDVAEESTQFARYNILVQAGTAMLAQANSSPQSVLRLLG